ncbi:hypothetical protein Srufu_044730 [Streptomyces libani subsp. rufus]|nr:hypothetical protein Srufu_044730 [Streptomyces libani subsp. rufus]
MVPGPRSPVAAPESGDRAVPLRARPASVELTYRQDWVVAALCAMVGRAWSFDEVLGVFR